MAVRPCSFSCPGCKVYISHYIGILGEIADLAGRSVIQGGSLDTFNRIPGSRYIFWHDYYCAMMFGVTARPHN
jgi:hypothetical protein